MSSTLGSDLGSLLRSGLFADAEIVFRDGKSMKVHKNVLASRSKFFKHALDPEFGFQESISGVITLIEDPQRAVERMIEFLYTSAYSPKPSQLFLDEVEGKTKGEDEGEKKKEDEDEDVEEDEIYEYESDEFETESHGDDENDDSDENENENHENESQAENEDEIENNGGDDVIDDNTDTVLLHLQVYLLAHKFMIPALCEYSRARAMHVCTINQEDILHVVKMTYGGLNPILEEESWRSAIVWLGVRWVRMIRCNNMDLGTAKLSLEYPNFWLDVAKYLARKPA